MTLNRKVPGAKKTEDTRRIRALVVDDSALMRKMVADHLSAHPRIEVVGMAADGKIGLRMYRDLMPDVVSLDLEMPGMDGLEVLAAIMETDDPRSVIMLSAHTRRGADLTFRALEAGAADYVPKPSGSERTMEKVLFELTERILALAGHRPMRRARTILPVKHQSTVQQGGATLAHSVAPHADLHPDCIVGIGISTGGPPALQSVLSSFTKECPPIAVVQHMPEDFIPAFTSRLASASTIRVSVAEDGMRLEQGMCVIAPGDRHLEVHRSGMAYRLRLNQESKISGHRPSADALLSSIAKAGREHGIGVLMTGMGRDGVRGMTEIKRNGGRTLVQDEATCVVYGMPGAAVEAGCVDEIVPLSKIPRAILNFTMPNYRKNGG